MSTAYANNNRLPTDLTQLQNLVKKDSESYAEEFQSQYDHYQATKDVFEEDPTVYNGSLLDLVKFLAAIATCYPKELSSFPSDLVSLLERHGSTLHPEMRMGFVKSLVLLRNKNLLSPTELLQLFFKLLRSPDKGLRTFLQQHIVTDIKNINSKAKDTKVNKELQNFMFEMLKNNHAVAVKTSVDIMIELYKKHIWNDPKTVNIIASACFSKIAKVMVSAVKFFVGVDLADEESDSDSDESEDEGPSMRQVAHNLKINKSKKSKLKQMEKAKSVVRKDNKKKKIKAAFDFSAIHLIYDPQTIAERLYKKLEASNDKFEIKLMIMNFVSRLIGLHELYIPNFYPYLQRYLFVNQRDVTKIMVFAAQASHPLVPPDDMEPMVRTLADNFVTDRYSGEVMGMGMNAIREVCARNPYCMNEDLLQDLTAFKTHRDKAIAMAARSLITLFRDKNPALLVRKHRGAPTELAAENKVIEFGDSTAKNFIPGAELVQYLPSTDANEDTQKDDDDDDSSASEWSDGSDDESEEEDAPEMSKKTAMKEIMKLSVEERAEKAQEVVTTQLLTDEDFKRIDQLQAAKQVERFSASRKKLAKRKREEDQIKGGEFVSLKSIEMVHKKRKHDKDARIESMMEGREGRDKFGSRKGRSNPNASKTNRERDKAKNFQMIKHKLFADKQRRSFRDKQLKLKKSMMRQLKN